MKTRWFGVFGLLPLVAGLAGMDERAPIPSPSSRGASEGPTTLPIATPPNADWSWPTEEQWILSSVARDLAEMAIHAKGQPVDGLDLKLRALPDEAPPRYELTLHAAALGSGLSHTMALDTHVWDPSAYAGFARGLLTKLKLKRSPAPLVKPVFVALVHPTSDVLERQNEEISRGLEKAILSPVLNEQAALLLATLSLREAAMGLSDIRRQLNRLTAHLALADALRGDEPASADGALASIALSAIVGRQREAVDRIDVHLKKTASPEERAWLGALKMRSTSDWRLLPDPGKATLLERLEHVRALANMQSPLKALSSLEANPPEPAVDWGRVLLLRATFEVEVGSALASGRLPAELAELAGVFRASKGRELAPDQVVTELGVRPGRYLSPSAGGPRPQVIDWGTWAAYCQRHLLAALVVQELCLRRVFGLEKEADDFRKEMTSQYGALPLFRFLEAAWQKRPSPQQSGNPSSMPPDAPFCGPAAQLVRRVPEDVPPIVWPLLVQHCPRSAWTKELIDPGLWFQPRLPRGTTFDYDFKKPLVMWGLIWARAAEVFEPLHALAPYDKWILRDLLEAKYGAAATPEQIEELWGPLREYDATLERSLLRAAARRDDATLVRYAQKACDADAEVCALIANELSDRGLTAEALPFFERGYRSARDRVGLSNYEGRAIDHYFDVGQTEKALEMAQEGAAVYSEAGLANMGRLLERLGEYEEAEAVYKRTAERYPGAQWELDLFYVRYLQRIGGGLFRDKAAEAMSRVFPQGLEKASAKDWKEPLFPVQGATVPPDSPRAAVLQRAGVRPGDLIVAIDGFRVRNDTQYVCVMRLSDQSEVSVLVWREGRLLELKGPILRLHFGPRTTKG
jgi:tetratricopeptide (TPR) repeat protein